MALIFNLIFLSKRPLQLTAEVHRAGHGVIIVPLDLVEALPLIKSDGLRQEGESIQYHLAVAGHPGLLHQLVHQLMQEARVAGYRQMVLDTFPFLPEAITLYKREGFYEIERYNDNPMPGSVYLCCEL